jgi:Spy/CpxP family protein refolding chaperone
LRQNVLKGETKMKRNLQYLVLASLLAFMPAVVSFSAEDASAEKKPLNDEARFEAAAGRLNLTAEQREKIKALRQDQRQQMQALMQELREKRQQIREKLNDPATTRETIAPLVAEIKEIQSKIVDLRINNIFAIKETLSAEQVSKLQQFRQQRGSEGRGRRPFCPEKRRMSNEENNPGL